MFIKMYSKQVQIIFYAYKNIIIFLYLSAERRDDHEIHDLLKINLFVMRMICILLGVKGYAVKDFGLL